MALELSKSRDAELEASSVSGLLEASAMGRDAKEREERRARMTGHAGRQLRTSNAEVALDIQIEDLASSRSIHAAALEQLEEDSQVKYPRTKINSKAASKMNIQEEAKNSPHDGPIRSLGVSLLTGEDDKERGRRRARIAGDPVEYSDEVRIRVSLINNLETLGLVSSITLKH